MNSEASKQAGSLHTVFTRLPFVHHYKTRVMAKMKSFAYFFTVAAGTVIENLRYKSILA